MIASTEQKKYVTYLRVSTGKQGAAGLGIDAQRFAVKEFAARNNGVIVSEFVEVESGKKDSREILIQALHTAKSAGAILLVAKLDRLSRSVSFIFALRDSGTEFVCADCPEFNTLTISVYAAIAQHERELISGRTKSALQAKKMQGAKLGTPANLTESARKKGTESIRRKAEQDSNNKRALKYAAVLREKGYSIRQIQTALNENDYRTARGNLWSVSAVKYLIDRAK